MDKTTRNNIQDATQATRALLERTFSEQLEGTFDILLDGTISEQAGSHLSDRQKVTREELCAAVTHKRSAGLKAKEAVDAYLREAAFTTLNRFVALKMLEARELVQECVSKGDDSSGFKEFTALAPGLVALSDKGYRLYIETVFDEIGQEVKVLFDRRDVASLLWPDRQTLLELLGILNAPDLVSVWAEDETIGWIYQYFNGDDERSKMREESQTPRNSRELAVRNQFFTPRYVVQFLTDNTLGRIWYEMMQGETKLTHLDYLVRRPTEVFLAEGKPAPESAVNDSELNQEELLQQTVYVPFRAKKDPRDLRVLDPACGSGHFLLYAFKLLVSIYEEAWSDAGAAAFSETGTQLREDFDSLGALRRVMPELILRQNLHGVDIDPRATQIAALALWMRAQRAYNQFDVGRAERPPITKTNIVVAEPMPGDTELVEEFAASLKPAILGDLFKKMVEEMKLAGELGTLLKIEEAISEAVKDTAKSHQQGILFGEKIESQDFWDTADEKIVAALASFAERAVGSSGIARQLFAGDAAQGVAFIELVRKRFDAVLMNPPFGDGAERTAEYISKNYRFGSRNIICAFVERVRILSAENALVGAVSDRTVNIKKTYGDFRREHLLGDKLASLVLDLGWGVLDANVEVTSWVLTCSAHQQDLLGIDLSSSTNKGAALVDRIGACGDHPLQPNRVTALRRLPNAVIGYFFPDFVVRAFTDNPSLADAGFDFFEGHTIKSARYFRYCWELPAGTPLDSESDWARLFNGAPYSPFYFPLCEVVPYGREAHIIGAHAGTVLRNLNKHFARGICYGKRGEFVDAHVLPTGFVSTVEGRACGLSDGGKRWAALALLNSRFFQFVVNMYCGQHKYGGYVGLFPFAGVKRLARAGRIAETIADKKAQAFRLSEISPFFAGFSGWLAVNGQRSSTVKADSRGN